MKLRALRVLVVTLLCTAGIAFSYLVAHDPVVKSDPAVPGGVVGPFMPA